MKADLKGKAIAAAAGAAATAAVSEIKDRINEQVSKATTEDELKEAEQRVKDEASRVEANAQVADEVTGTHGKGKDKSDVKNELTYQHVLRISLPNAHIRMETNTPEGDWSNNWDKSIAVGGRGVSYTGSIDRTNLLDVPYLLGGLEISRGVTAVMGPPESGKTALLGEIYLRAKADQKPVSLIIHNEPIEPGRIFSNAGVCSSETEFIIALGTIIRAPGDGIGLIDSMSAQAFQSWPGWGLGKYGINSGMLFWLTQLHNVAARFGKALIVSFNPGLDDEKLVHALFTVLKGRVAGVINCTGYMNGVYTWRSSGGRRPTKSLSEILNGVPGGRGLFHTTEQPFATPPERSDIVW